MCRETTSSNNNNRSFTTQYNYGNESEFILCCKGRPFAVLVSPSLQTPTSTLMDYDLARSLGLKLTDLQCRRYTLAGNRFRILGRVTTAVQCVQNGKVGSTFHLRCDVVADLYATLDTHCVASANLEQYLGSQETIMIVDDGYESRAPARAAPPGPGATCPPGPAQETPLLATPPRPSASTAAPSLVPSTPPRASVTSPTAAARSPPRSPPGFPTTPQYGATAATRARSVPSIPVVQWVKEDGQQMSPLEANITALGAIFHNADVHSPDDCQESFILEEVDPEGELEDDYDGKTIFKLKNRLSYKFGHGRNVCSKAKCFNNKDQKFPSNCGFNPQWMLPANFTPCGSKCRGGFCPCLITYPDDQYHREEENEN